MTQCPHCKVDLKSQPIPKKDRPFYGGKAHYGREIYVSEYSDKYRIKRKYFVCPDCKKEIDK